MVYLQIALILCLIFGISGFFLEKKLWINPLTIFCGLWAVILYFSSLQKYTMYMASNEKNYIIMIGIISYILGYLINRLFLKNIHFKFGRHSFYSISKKYQTIPRYTMLYAFCIVCIVYTLFTLINVIRQSGTFNLGTIQNMLQSGDIVSANGPILNAISLLIIAPVKFALPAITAVDFWFGRRDKILLYMTICLVIINMLSSANRTSFMLFFLWLLMVLTIYLYHYEKEKRKFYDKVLSNKVIAKINKYKRLLIVVGILAFVLMTLSRGTSSITKQLYLYFSMPPSMFEIWADKIEAGNVYGYGIASLLGFIYPFFYIFKNLLGLGIPQIIQSIYDWTMLTDTLWVWPGKNIRANAYVSIFWFLYLDGRQIGVVIGMFILGLITSRSFSNITSKSVSAKQIAIYCCLFYVILFSFVRLQFTLSRIALAFIFIIFFTYKNVPKEIGVKKL